jgi:hypothetical protein
MKKLIEKLKQNLKLFWPHDPPAPPNKVVPETKEAKVKAVGKKVKGLKPKKKKK